MTLARPGIPAARQFSIVVLPAARARCLSPAPGGVTPRDRAAWSPGSEAVEHLLGEPPFGRKRRRIPWPTRCPRGAPAGPGRPLDFGGIPGQIGISPVSGGRSTVVQGLQVPPRTPLFAHICTGHIMTKRRFTSPSWPTRCPLEAIPGSASDWILASRRSVDVHSPLLNLLSCSSKSASDGVAPYRSDPSVCPLPHRCRAHDHVDTSVDELAHLPREHRRRAGRRAVHAAPRCTAEEHPQGETRYLAPRPCSSSTTSFCAASSRSGHVDDERRATACS